jgi:hypothetical protein
VTDAKAKPAVVGKGSDQVAYRKDRRYSRTHQCNVTPDRADGNAHEATTPISLSVERKNFARGLYLCEGYVVVDASDPQPDTMVKSLDARR